MMHASRVTPIAAALQYVVELEARMGVRPQAMGKLRISLALVLVAACGSSSNHGQLDAKTADAPIDTRPIDAPMPDASPYDFSCLTNQQPTTAPDTLAYAGTTEAITTGGLSAAGAVALNVYKVSAPTTSIAMQTSASDGTFSMSLTTGGMPLDVFVTAANATYRTAYVYPPNPLHAAAAGVLIPVISDATFTELSGLAGTTQDDSVNGALFVQVQDCAGMSVAGVTLHVQQAGTDVGTLFDLGELTAQAAGDFFAFNVPDGATQLTVTIGTLTFPTTARTVGVHKKPATTGAEATITVTQVVPGPST